MKKTWTLPTNEEFLREFAPELLEMQGGVALDPQDGTGAQPTIFNFVLDVSGSMSAYYQTLVDSFNQIMIPGLLDVRMQSNNTLLIGGILFSDKLIPLWPGFKSVKSLGDKALELQQLNAVGLRNQTALYRAMISALIWTHEAMVKFKRDHPFNSSGIQGKVCILTDGANNCEPFDAALVQQALEQFTKINRRGKRDIQCTLAFLKTSIGLTEDAAKNVATATGFDFSGFYDLTTAQVVKGEQQTPQQMFRHAFDLWSKRQTAK